MQMIVIYNREKNFSLKKEFIKNDLRLDAVVACLRLCGPLLDPGKETLLSGIKVSTKHLLKNYSLMG